MSSFEIILITLAIAVVTVSLLRRLQLPPILGYLIAGALVGPYGLELLESKEEIRYIAEFGVVFLLFSIGLELSFPKLISMRRALLGMGGLQVLLTTLAVFGAAQLAGLTIPASFAIGGAIAFSSTAVVIKQLIEQDELHQPHGKLALAILLFQDLAAVPFLIVIPALASSGDADVGGILLQRIITGTVIFLVMLAAGRWLLRPLFHFIARSRSSELFMLATLLLVLGSAFLTEHYGLSAALGAFLAGVMLGETEYAHQLESDIQPFRDILLGMFFISVGLLIDPRIMISYWPIILGLLATLVIFKAALIAGLAKLTNTPSLTGLKTGFILAQGGEFGLFLIAVAFKENIVNLAASQIVITAIVLSMALSPVLIRKSKPLSRAILQKITKTPPKEDHEDLETPPQHRTHHVILCGYGRVGQTLARFLEFEGISYIGLDIDPVRLREARLAQEPVYFGDPAQESVLKAAGVDNARMVIIAFSNPKQALKILQNIRRINKSIPVLVRTTDDSELESLQIAGATEVIPEKLESSLMLASHMLILLGTSPVKTQQQVQEIKANRYRFLQGFFEGEKIGHLEAKSPEKKHLHAVELPESAYAIGRTVEEFIAKKVPIKISSFKRQGIKCAEIAPHTLLEAGDILVLEGTNEEIYNTEEKLLQG